MHKEFNPKYALTASSGEIRPSGTTAVASMQIAPTPRVANPYMRINPLKKNQGLSPTDSHLYAPSANQLHVRYPSYIDTWETPEAASYVYRRYIHKE